MPPCVGVGVVAVPRARMPLVDMEAKNIIAARVCAGRKPVNFCIYQNVCADLVKPDDAVYFTSPRVSHQVCISGGHLGQGDESGRRDNSPKIAICIIIWLRGKNAKPQMEIILTNAPCVIKF